MLRIEDTDIAIKREVRSREVRCLLLDLTLMVALTHWVCFLFFLRELLMLWPPVLV